MTTNPYAPPVIDPGSAAVPDPPPRSFARRTSFVLAAVGFVVFWGAVVFAASKGTGAASEGVEVATGFAVLIAMIMHMVGIGIVFAAPRGRRLLPALLNGVSLGIMIAIVAYGLSKG